MRWDIKDKNVQRESKGRVARILKERKKENGYTSVIYVVTQVIKNTIALSTIGTGRKKEQTLVQKAKSS
jgi:hypothetical protein